MGPDPQPQTPGGTEARLPRTNGNRAAFPRRVTSDTTNALLKTVSWASSHRALTVDKVYVDTTKAD